MKSIRFLHKWLSLVVAVQLVIWLSSGLFFNLMDHDKASGNQYRQRVNSLLVIDHQMLVEPKLGLLDKQSQSLKLISLLDQPYYLFNHQQALYRHLPNSYSLMNAYSGELMVIDESMAIDIAKTSYKGGSGGIDIASVKKLSPPIADIPKEQNVLWQININDEAYTSIYLDAGSGKIIGHVNDDKRFADFFFMLHFMDYGSVGNFNNWQIIFFSLLMLVLSLTGFIWVIDLARKGRYRVTKG
ncbi:MAG: PepSY domain-containing protein [Colwellia sp.]|nr:PepSY domain-containing protein [Colwellia sp.]